MIITKFVGTSQGAGDYQIELNGDSANSNYVVHVLNFYQSGSPINTLSNPGSGAGLAISGTAGSANTANSIFATKTLLFAKTGAKRIALYEGGKNVSTAESIILSGSLIWENSTSNITDMRFFYTNGAGIGAGSRIEIWAPR
jgi:hypothetical protein